MWFGSQARYHKTPTPVSGEATEQFSLHLSEVFFLHSGIQGSLCLGWPSGKGVRGFPGTSKLFLFLADLIFVAVFEHFFLLYFGFSYVFVLL